MPASMMSAPTGSTPKVIGRSIVIVAIGPTPGSTPMSVPTRQPMKARKTFCSDSAVENPSARLAKRSVIRRPSEHHDARDDQDGDRQVERVLEEADAERRDHHGEDEDLPEPGLRRGGGADERDEGPRQDEPDGADRRREGEDAEADEERAAQRPALEPFTLLQAGGHGQRHPDQRDEDRDAAWEHAGTHRPQRPLLEVRARPEREERERDQA